MSTLASRVVVGSNFPRVVQVVLSFCLIRRANSSSFLTAGVEVNRLYPQQQPQRQQQQFFHPRFLCAASSDSHSQKPMPVSTRQRKQKEQKQEDTIDNGFVQDTVPETPSSSSNKDSAKRSSSRKRTRKDQPTPVASSSDTLVSAQVTSSDPIPDTPLPDPAATTSTSTTTPGSGRGKRVKQSPRSPKQPPQPIKAPTDWEDIYSLVEELRQDRTAPCDSMGCEALATKEENDLPGFRFQVLVALLLSSQTKDAMVSEAVRLMKQDGILSIAALGQAHITTELLASKYLAKVGFRNNKAKYLKEVVGILESQYQSDIPPTASKMMELPGIGPKMAYICESAAWDPEVPSGIGVDTHMHRLFNQLGWVKAKTPEQTRVQLESWLPIEKWKTVNLLWVGFGQEVQQEKAKILKKALGSTRPAAALKLLKRCGLDLKKDGTKCDLYDEIQAVLKIGKEK